MMDEITHTHFGSIKAYIQQPKLHMLVLCSSVEDQAALIGDRNACISELLIPLHDSRGTEIRDELVLFYGDKAAQQVERGRSKKVLFLWVSL